jgi:hypothetical protein
MTAFHLLDGCLITVIVGQFENKAACFAGPLSPELAQANAWHIPQTMPLHSDLWPARPFARTRLPGRNIAERSNSCGRPPAFEHLDHLDQPRRPSRSRGRYRRCRASQTSLPHFPDLVGGKAALAHRIGYPERLDSLRCGLLLIGSSDVADEGGGDFFRRTTRHSNKCAEGVRLLGRLDMADNIGRSTSSAESWARGRLWVGL